MLPGAHHAAAIHIPDDLPIESLDPAAVRVGRRRFRYRSSIRRRMASPQRSAVLIVPSIPGQPVERNFIINPGHPDAARIRVLPPFDVVWDGRLFGPPTTALFTAEAPRTQRLRSSHLGSSYGPASPVTRQLFSLALPLLQARSEPGERCPPAGSCWSPMQCGTGSQRASTRVGRAGAWRWIEPVGPAARVNAPADAERVECQGPRSCPD